VAGFEEEYQRRLRRVGGVYDNSLKVWVESGEDDGYWSGGCETCEFYIDGGPYVKVFVDSKISWEIKREIARFSDMGELIRELDSVDDDGE
jgi:hypothetical protein